jgi:vitamin B12 transporter
MRNPLFSILIVGTLAGCAATPVKYEVGGQTAQGERKGSQLIAESATAAAAAQTADADQSPKLLRSEAPVLPREVIARGIEGDVQVELSIDHQGKVSDVQILQSPDVLLSEAVTIAMRKWAFGPLIKNGVPQAFKTRQTYRFRLAP